MFKLEAPWPAPMTVSLLPSPQFGDTEALDDTVSLSRAIDGTPYSYVHRKGRKKSVWHFTVTRNKALELLEFYKFYGAKQIRATDHKDRVWIGYITNNPFEGTMDKRSGPPLQDWPVGETGTVSIEFEGSLE